MTSIVKILPASTGIDRSTGTAVKRVGRAVYLARAREQARPL